MAASVSLTALLFMLCCCCFTFSLRIKFKADFLPLNMRMRNGLGALFTILRQELAFDVIFELLDMKTVDLSFGYVESCQDLTSFEYRSIIEHCMMKKNQAHKLKTLLSPNCLLCANKSIFQDPVNSIALNDLPYSLLETDLHVFNIRPLKGTFTFQRIVKKSLELRSRHINWNNFIGGAHDRFNAHLPLSEAFAAMKPYDLRNILFYYLNPSMVYDCIDYDIHWLVENVLPFSPQSSPGIEHLVFLDGAVLTTWTTQIFRMVSSLAIYFEIEHFSHVITDHHSHRYGILMTAKDNLLMKLTIFNNYVNYLRVREPRCRPFLNILNTLNDLHVLFLGNIEVSRLIKSRNVYNLIVAKFRDYVSSSIQGDWLLNLFALFWRRKLGPLNITDIESSIGLFFSRNPTTNCIRQVFTLFTSVFNRDHTSALIMRAKFENLIPESRLLDLYKLYLPSLIEKRFTLLPFKIRHGLWLRRYRTESCLSLSNYELTMKYKKMPEEPPNDQLHTQKYKENLLQVLVSTVVALQRSTNGDTKIYPYGPLKLVEKSLKRSVDIREALLQFFNLILRIEDFRIIISSDSESRPVVIFTPLISKSLANFLGQSLLLASVLNIKVPFIIEKRHFSAIVSYTLPEDLRDEIRAFCNTPARLKIILSQNDELKGRNSLFDNLTKYFKEFYKWANIFAEDAVTPEDDPFQLIDESFMKVNSNISYGFIIHLNNSKFTLDELYHLCFFAKR